ncbi:MAG: glycosyltransferase [Candidatus Woesearchaeota archaeon]
MRKIKIAIIALQHSQKGDLRINQEYNSISKIRNSEILSFKKRSNPIKNLIKTYRKIIKFKPHIIHAHDLQSYILSYFLVKRLKNSKLILDFHEFNDKVKKYYNFFGKLTYYFYKFMEKELFQKADYIIKAVDEIQKQNIVKYQKRSITIHNFPIIKKNKVSKKRKNLNLVYAGGISPERGIFKNIKLLEILNSKKNISCKLHLIGNTNDLLKDINNKNIIYYGRIPHKEVSNILNKCDVGLCLLDKRESFDNSQPIKIFEYLNAGLFVLCSKLKRPQEMIKNKNVIMFSGDLNLMANKIEKLYQNNEFNYIKKEAKSYVNKKFNWINEEKKILKIYEELIQK